MAQMTTLKLYTVGRCKECDHVRKILEKLGLEYEEMDVTKDPYREEVVRATGCYSVPQLMYNGRHVGNYDTIIELYKEKKLMEMLV